MLAAHLARWLQSAAASRPFGPLPQAAAQFGREVGARHAGRLALQVAGQRRGDRRRDAAGAAGGAAGERSRHGETIARGHAAAYKPLQISRRLSVLALRYSDYGSCCPCCYWRDHEKNSGYPISMIDFYVLLAQVVRTQTRVT